MRTMRMGYLGAGNISGQMAATVARMGEVENYAVAARDPERAREFAGRWGFSRAYGSYEELLADPDVDLVYVALPHSHHHRWTIAALEAGHHVLCEKAFAANERQARDMVACARERGLLLAEAIWTRYMPSRKMIDEIVSSGEIGEVTTVAANLGYRVDGSPRMSDPALAGGALLDLTVYPLNFASMVLGNGIRRIVASMVPAATGVDGQDNVNLQWKHAAVLGQLDEASSRDHRHGRAVMPLPRAANDLGGVPGVAEPAAVPRDPNENEIEPAPQGRDDVVGGLAGDVVLGRDASKEKGDSGHRMILSSAVIDRPIIRGPRACPRAGFAL